jgi:archaetidylinositol phosphate synthase
MSGRSNKGLLAGPEARLLDVLVARVPRGVSPDMLSLLALLGAVLGSAGFALALSSGLSLGLVLVGFTLNWLGDSLDGRVARYRGIERRIQGFVLDNGLDLLAYLLLAIGFALSGLVSLPIPFLLLALYTLLSNLALARLLITGVHDLAIDVIGTTELRVLFLLLAVLLFLLPDVFAFVIPLIELSVLDFLSLFWACVMLLHFFTVLRRDLRQAERADRPG